MKTFSLAVLFLVLCVPGLAQTVATPSSAGGGAADAGADPGTAARQRRSDVQAAAGQTGQGRNASPAPVRQLSAAERSELRRQLGQNRPAGFEPASAR
jgi:hypothetical protein